MDKRRVADILGEIALYLELKGENLFKIRAYENGARIIQALDEDLEVLVREKRLGTIKGIGKALEEKNERRRKSLEAMRREIRDEALDKRNQYK
mgnify:CR=1 FL=1